MGEERKVGGERKVVGEKEWREKGRVEEEEEGQREWKADRGERQFARVLKIQSKAELNDAGQEVMCVFAPR